MCHSFELVLFGFFHVNIGVIIFASHCYINACVVIFNSYYSLFTNLFCLLNLQKIAKKEKSSSTSSNHRFIIFWYECSNISCLCLASIHVLKFVFRICLICSNNNVGTIMCLGIIILRSPKGGPVKILTRSSISPGFQTKANFKVTVSR